MSKKVAIINFGGGNLFSVSHACKAADMEPFVTQDPVELDNADLLFLPGVGAFQKAMAFLQERELDEAILRNVEKGKLLVGICLGMQIMTSQSEEFGQTKGLNLIPGSVSHFKGALQDGGKIPHTGWSSVRNVTKGSVMGEAEAQDFYFIHSLYAQTEDPAHTIAHCRYHNVDFAASIAKDNVIGFQFHPERSGANGLALYREIKTRAS